MAAKLDLTNKTIGRLFIRECTEKKNNRGSYIWICECTCGNVVERTAGSLMASMRNNADSTSCGCFQREQLAEMGKELNKTHGLTKTRQYRIYMTMLNRCNNPKCQKYDYYGGRGITYHDSWSTFEGFWADMQEGYSDDLELDRIDGDDHYYKENCRWVTKSEQQFNKKRYSTNTSGRTGVKRTPNGKKWLAEINVNKKCINLGYFENFDDAVKAREEAELKYFGFTKE